MPMHWLNRYWKKTSVSEQTPEVRSDVSSQDQWLSQSQTLLINQLGQQLSQNLTNAPMGCVLLGTDHQVLWFNSLAAQWLGLQAHDCDRPLTHLIRLPLVAAFLDSPHHRLTIEHGKRWLRLQRIPLVPHLSLLEIEPEEDRVAAARAQRDFLAAVSHELNTPLTVINGFLELLEDHIEHQHSGMILESLRNQTQRLSNLSSQLLQLLRAEQASSPRFQSLDAQSFFERIENETTAIHIENRTLTWRIDKTLSLYGDESSLYSAIRNLIDNAIRYTSAQTGQINIAWYKNNQGASVFEVHDNGIGIAPEHLSRLGERFYRAGDHSIAGTGLGLSIVKQVAQHHQAELQIESTLGQGSTFRILLRSILQ